MIIKNKYLYIFPATILIAGFLFLTDIAKVFAALEITEIMYDLSGTDTGREWIEIYNPDSNPVDITKIKLREASTNHGIATSSGGNILNPLGYAVIADVPANFLTDNPGYSGILFDSTFSLSNTGEPLELKDSSSTRLDLVTYDSSVGAGGDGNTLQKINGTWIAASSTPGLENIFVPASTSTATTTSSSGGTSTTTSTSTSTTTSSSSNGSSQTSKTSVRTVYISTHSSEEDLSDYNQIQIFETSAGRQRTAYIGVPIEFKVSYKIPKNMESNARIFKWSFGDGFEALGEKVIHTYKHPGEYNLVLNAELGDEHSVSRTLVNVLSPNISLAILPDNSIEISNIGNTEINLGLWRIKDTSNEFVIAQDTIIGAGKKIILSIEDTKINTQNKRISLNNPSGGEVSYINNTNNLVTTQASDDPSITVAKAEELYAEYKKSLALKSEQSTNSNNQNISKNIRQNQTPEETDLSKTASVIESADGTSTAGFFVRIWRGSISGIKSVARLFYDF